MSSSRFYDGAALSVLTAIIRGEAWTASSLRNPILRKNYRRLNRIFCRSHSITDSLREPSLRLFSVIAERSELLSSEHRLGRELVSVLIRVSAYSDRWIRSPEAWVPMGGDVLRDLMKHLFVQWELPTFFEKAWLAKGDLRYLERDWYCDLAMGKNWRKLEKVPTSVTSRAIHWALQAPESFSIRQALRWGQLMAMGADDDLIEMVLQSAVVQNLSNDEIWFRLLKKVMAAEGFVSHDFGMIADYFEMLYQRSQYFRARELVGLPLDDLRRHCRAYWSRLLEHALEDGLKFDTQDLGEAGLRRELLHFTSAVWDPMEGVHEYEVTPGTKPEEAHLKIIQLQRHSQLIAEGLAMKHCVGGYRRACQRGYSAIFSLRESNEEGQTMRSIMTIEVSRKTRRIVQAKAKWNDWPSHKELEILEAWASRNQLWM